MTRKSFLSSAAELKKNSQLTTDPLKFLEKFFTDKVFKKSINKAILSIEKNTKKEIICHVREPFDTQEKHVRFDFMIGEAGKKGHYNCSMLFDFSKENFELKVFSDCKILKKNSDEYYFYAEKNFNAVKEKQAKEYFFDLVYELGKAKIEGRF